MEVLCALEHVEELGTLGHLQKPIGIIHHGK